MEVDREDPIGEQEQDSHHDHSHFHHHSHQQHQLQLQQQVQHHDMAASYSLYPEPHYQQLHPLIYLEDATLAHHHHHQHWDQDHFIHVPMTMTEVEVEARSQQTDPAVQDNAPVELDHMIPGEGDLKDQMAETNQMNQRVPFNHVAYAKSSPAASAAGTETKEQSRWGGQAPERLTRKIILEKNAVVGTNREMHNEIERRRRSRIKHCCEVLRTLVPGLNDKTDKATVLEHTVKFVDHLANCPGCRCRCSIEE